MNELLTSYKNSITGLLDQLLCTQQEAIEQAAGVLCAAILEDRRIHLLGAGAHAGQERG